MINKEQALYCLGQMEKPTFDTHDFIEQFMKDFEREYVELLCDNIDVPNGVFRSAHAAIGRFLSENQTQLNIRPTNKEASLNVKGYLSDNQKWEKCIMNNI